MDEQGSEIRMFLRTFVIFCFRFRNNLWRESETELEVIVDPIFVHLNLDYVVIGGNNWIRPL